jgi:hypothetical protein
MLSNFAFVQDGRHHIATLTALRNRTARVDLPDIFHGRPLQMAATVA